PALAEPEGSGVVYSAKESSSGPVRGVEMDFTTDAGNGLERGEHRQPPADMPIPARLNSALVLLVLASAVSLLWLGSCLESSYAVLAVGVAYSYVLLTNYALLHEAAHGNLHPSPRINYLFGLATGLLFPVPFTMIRTTHQGHHLRNRTDFEMFD